MSVPDVEENERRIELARLPEYEEIRSADDVMREPDTGDRGRVAT